MNTRRWKLYRRLTKATYGLGILFLLVGMVLSMVNQPVSAASSRQDESPTQTEAAPAQEEQPTQEPSEAVPTQEEPGEVTLEPTAEGTQLPTSETTEEPLLEETEIVLTEVPTEVPSETLVPTFTPTFTATPLSTVAPVIEGKVEYTSGDSALCQYTEGWIDATVRVTLPEGVTGRLQTSYYIVNPPNKRTSPTYAIYSVTNGDEITVSAYWPGVSAGDEVVEIHWGARLSVLESGIDTQLSTDGLDFYWYPWVCGQNPTATPVPVQEITVNYLCTDNGLAFNAANPNNFELELNYSLDGSPAVATIPAGSNVNFVTTQSGAHTLEYDWNRGTFTQSGSITSPSNTCGQEQSEPGQLALSFECAGDGINWTVTNTNDFPVTFDWLQVPDSAAAGSALLAVDVSSGDSGTNTVPANSSLIFYKSALGTATIQISYVINEEELGTTLSNGDEYCRTQEITPTPSDPGDPTATPTPSDPGNPQPTSTPSDSGNPQPTPTVPLFAPQASSGNAVLIPVTGADLTAQPGLPGSDFVKKLLTNLGLFFLGTAFVLQSVTNKFRQP